MAKQEVNNLLSSISDIKESAKPTVRLTVPVTREQEEILTRIARTITENRDKAHRNQRVTKAAIIRTYIDAMSTISFDSKNISNESLLLERILIAIHRSK